MLGHLFDYGSNRKVLFDYPSDYRSAVAIDRLWYDHKTFIEKTFWGIHGQFFYEKYAFVFPEEFFITCVSHPLTRLEKQFKQEIYDALHDKYSWRAENLLSGQMSFVDFVQSDEHTRKCQTMRLAGRDICDYSFVFVNEYLEPSLEAFSKMFDFSRNDPFAYQGINNILEPQWLFSDPTKRASFETLTNINNDQRQFAFLLIPEDIEIYSRAVERLLRDIAS